MSGRRQSVSWPVHSWFNSATRFPRGTTASISCQTAHLGKAREPKVISRWQVPSRTGVMAKPHEQRKQGNSTEPTYEDDFSSFPDCGGAFLKIPSPDAHTDRR